MKPKYRFFANASYAISGLRLVLKETSFRIELALCFLAALVALLLPFSLLFKALILLSLLLIFAAECFNTAIERLSDFMEPNFNEKIGAIKDLGSAAVLCTVISAVLVYVFALLSLFLD